MRAESESEYSYSIYRLESQIDEASGPSEVRRRSCSQMSDCDVEEGDLKKNFMCVSNSDLIASQALPQHERMPKPTHSESSLGYSEIIRS